MGMVNGGQTDGLYGRSMVEPCFGHPVVSVPHASVMPCLGFEALIIKQVIRVSS